MRDRQQTHAAAAAPDYVEDGMAIGLGSGSTAEIFVKLLADKETDRIPNAVKWDNYSYARSNLTGTINLTNRRSDTVTLEIRRSISNEVIASIHDSLQLNKGYKKK